MFKNIDWRLVFIPLLATVFGLAAIFSVAPELFSKQLAFVVVALLGYVIFAIVDYRLLRRFGWVAYGSSLLLLMLVLFFGERVRGSTRWFALGDFRLQPVELSKLLLAFFLAFFWEDKRLKLPDLVRLMVSILLLIPPAVLIFLEPDLGSALLLMTIWLPLPLISKVSKRSLLVVGLLVVLLFGGVSHFLLKDYQRERLLSFLDSGSDPLGASYQMRQSVIAVGSGRWVGKGFGFGTQSHLRFLPDRHTDFIFASIAEEWGLVGSLFLLALYIVILASILHVARGSADQFGLLFCLSTFCLLSFQITFNIFMNLGLAPITGIPLPLVSYGGSSLVTTFLLLGLVQNVALRRKV